MLMVMAVPASSAGPLDDAADAYRKGDYATARHSDLEARSGAEMPIMRDTALQAARAHD